MSSMFLCLGSTLAALVGLLVLGWGANRKRWRPLWVLIAAVFLIGAAFGAAETIFQMAAERTEEQTLKETVVSEVAVAPTPVPSRAQDLSALPTATPRPSAIQKPTAAAAETPTATLRATPSARSTLTPRPSPSPTTEPTAAVVEPSSAASVDIDALAASLIPAERDVLASLDDPPHYLINATVDFDALTVAGTAEIHYTNNETEELDAIYLRLYPNADYYEEGEIQIHAVNVDGDAADFRLEDPERTTLKVPLPEPLGPDRQTKLQIAFTVTVPRRSDRFGYDGGVMSLGHWYPMLAVYDDEGWNLDPYVPLGDPFYSDVANFTVHITVPDDTMIAASGVPVGEILHRPPRKTVVYGSGATREFALALSREYETARIQIGDTTVTSYYLPGHARGGVRALEVAADALEVYNDRFGLYPYTELDIAETSFTVMGAPGGMEFPGVVFISSDLYDPDSLFAFETDMIVAHEVAHQWWYGVVGNNQVDEPWLDEAFATYSSIIYYQDQGDPAMAEVAYWLQAVLPYQMVQMLGADGPLQSSLLDYDDELITYQSLVYSKGALFLARLRELLGDETFFALLQHHYEAHKYGLLEPDAFRRSLEEITRDANLNELSRAEILELYDAVVVRGEPIEGMAELDVLEGLGGTLEGQLSAGDVEEMLGLAEHLGGLLDGEVSPEELEDIMLFLEELLTGMEP
jgi:hypothetical protein